MSKEYEGAKRIFEATRKAIDDFDAAVQKAAPYLAQARVFLDKVEEQTYSNMRKQGLHVPDEPVKEKTVAEKRKDLARNAIDEGHGPKVANYYTNIATDEFINLEWATRFGGQAR